MKSHRVVFGMVWLVVFGLATGCVRNSTFQKHKEGEQAKTDSLRASMESLFVRLFDSSPTATESTSYYLWLRKLANAVCSVEALVPNLPPDKRICPNNKGGPGDQTTPPPPPQKP